MSELLIGDSILNINETTFVVGHGDTFLFYEAEIWYKITMKRASAGSIPTRPVEYKENKFNVVNAESISADNAYSFLVEHNFVEAAKAHFSQKFIDKLNTK